MISEVRCFLVERDTGGAIHRRVTSQPASALGDGDVLIQVAYSSLNFKDSLAAAGHAGVARRFPHVPGIDAAGTVVESRSPQFQEGDSVLVTSFELGAGHWGGWSTHIRVPATWVLPLPAGLTLREAMILGTAGLTAGMSVTAIQHTGIVPGAGEVLVTGATGGVGCLAVMLLAKLGYSVVAATGKPETHERLRTWGATRVVSRDEVSQPLTKPLLTARWSAAVDTVGGTTLATIIRELQERGCVAACGLVAGTDLPLTVYPFLLRGVSLIGIDSAHLPLAPRLRIWQHLATDWKPDQLDAIAQEVDLADGLEQAIERISRGAVIGRIVVRVG